jgi:hypothetical protein
MLSSSHHPPLHKNTRRLPSDKNEFEFEITRTIKPAIAQVTSGLFSSSYTLAIRGFFDSTEQSKNFDTIRWLKQAQIAINN